MAALLPVLKEDLVDVVCGARAAMHIYYFLNNYTIRKYLPSRSLVPVSFVRDVRGACISCAFLCRSTIAFHVPHPLSVASDERTERNCYA